MGGVFGGEFADGGAVAEGEGAGEEFFEAGAGEGGVAEAGGGAPVEFAVVEVEVVGRGEGF
jgi:hypothetical protein